MTAPISPATQVPTIGACRSALDALEPSDRPDKRARIEREQPSEETPALQVASYRGDLLNGLAHGHGTYDYGDGRSYTGQWVNSLPCGKGRLVFANGDLYLGDFVNAHLQENGVMFYADSEKYEGEFLNSLPHGQGKRFAADGSLIRAGSFSNGESAEERSLRASLGEINSE